jgi:hypothetical protein
MHGCSKRPDLAQMFTKNSVEWSWASIVLARSSQLPLLRGPKVPEELSTCPDLAAAGQVDRLVSTFEMTETSAPADISDPAKTSDLSMSLAWSDLEQQHAIGVQHVADITHARAEGLRPTGSRAPTLRYSVKTLAAVDRRYLPVHGRGMGRNGNRARDGDPMTCSAPTANGRSPGSTEPACCGS